MIPNRNLIRSYALVLVGVITAFVIGMSVWFTVLLSAPNWCDRAIGAAKDAPGETRPEYAVGGCFNLLNQQVGALAINSHIALGVAALCLLVLVVIVLAGGRLAFKAGREGIEGDMGADDTIRDGDAVTVRKEEP